MLQYFYIQHKGLHQQISMLLHRTNSALSTSNAPDVGAGDVANLVAVVGGMGCGRDGTSQLGDGCTGVPARVGLQVQSRPCALVLGPSVPAEQ